MIPSLPPGGMVLSAHFSKPGNGGFRQHIADRPARCSKTDGRHLPSPEKMAGVVAQSDLSEKARINQFERLVRVAFFRGGRAILDG